LPTFRFSFIKDETNSNLVEVLELSKDMLIEHSSLVRPASFETKTEKPETFETYKIGPETSIETQSLIGTVYSCIFVILTITQQICNKKNQAPKRRKINCMLTKNKMRKRNENSGIVRIGVSHIFETQRVGERHYGSNTQAALLA